MTRDRGVTCKSSSAGLEFRGIESRRSEEENRMMGRARLLLLLLLLLLIASALDDSNVLLQPLLDETDLKQYSQNRIKTRNSARTVAGRMCLRSITWHQFQVTWIC